MVNICCSIVSPSHLYKGLTTLMSLHEYNEKVLLYLILTKPVAIELEGITILNLDYFLAENKDARTIVDIYSGNDDAIRWSLKPVIMRSLIQKNIDANLIYCDCDMMFYDNPTHIFQYLKEGGIVLTPHWLPLYPEPNLIHFRETFRSGLFNAGFIAANAKGLPALDWWSIACISGCEIDYEKGLFVDQKYLDLFIIYFPETVICRHQGYNVAAWNLQIRTDFLESKQSIENLFPIIMVHFAGETMYRILRGIDKILEPYFVKYKYKLNDSLKLLYEKGLQEEQFIDQFLT